MADADKYYNQSGQKYKKYLKALKNQTKILNSIAKKSISHRELKNIKNIKAKANKKHRYSCSNSSSSDSASYSSLTSDSY